MENKGGCWPNQYQEYLLKASLLKGKEAIDAWYEWKSNVDVDQLDMGSHRLLPLLYGNLQTQGVEDPLMAKFKGVYRYTWYKNQTSFHKMAAILNAFHNAGIRTMVLKGAALTVLHYRDYGLRPMADFDLLVPTEQALAAIDLLVDLGWKPIDKSLKTIAKSLFHKTRHAEGFKDANGSELDLHWHVLIECLKPNSDIDFWNDAMEMKIKNIATRALSVTDQLFHICVHGGKYCDVSPIRWIADAIMILNTSRSDIDWDRLIVQAEKRRLVLPIKETLSYLKNKFDASIPQVIIENLNKIPVSKMERLEYKTFTQPLFSLPGGSFLPGNWFIYLRCSKLNDNSLIQPKFLGYPKFLQHFYGKDHLWQVPFYAAFKVFQRIWRTTLWHVKNG
ncbi:nucleotidyltransferase family protein [Thermodesulfobacteriota bacterium]